MNADSHPMLHLVKPLVVVLVVVAAVSGYVVHARGKAAKEIARLEAERVTAEREQVALRNETDRLQKAAADEKHKDEAREAYASRQSRFDSDRYRATSSYSYNGYNAGSSITQRDVAYAAAATEYERRAQEQRDQYQADLELRRARADAERQSQWVKNREREEERIRVERSYRR
jgi:hypothetical protein